MSLGEAMLELADQLDKDREALTAWDASDGMRFWQSLAMLKTAAQIIRTAVKATETKPVMREAHTPNGAVLDIPTVDALRQQAEEAAERERQKREVKRSAHVEELTPQLLIAEDGPMDGTYCPVPPDAPAGAYLNVYGHRYRLSEHATLIHDPPEVAVP